MSSLPLTDSEANLSAVYQLRKENIAQRKEIIALLRQLGDVLVTSAGYLEYPKWIRDRLTALGEEL